MQVSVTLLALLMAMFPLAGDSDGEKTQAMITTDRDTRQYIRSIAQSQISNSEESILSKITQPYIIC